MNRLFRVLLLLGVCVLGCRAAEADAGAEAAAPASRWELCEPEGIIWNCERGSKPHYDHIEMAGRRVATVVRYGVNEGGGFYLERGMVWPLLRTVPNNTHASLMRRMGGDVLSSVLINSRTLSGERVKSIGLNGLMRVESDFPNGVQLTRVLFPSVSLPVFCESYVLRNASERNMRVELGSTVSTFRTRKEDGVDGSYRIVRRQSGGSRILKPGESVQFAVTVEGYKPEESDFEVDVAAELEKRKKLVGELSGSLILDTPNEVMNTMFRFAKIRAAESIFETKGGLLHGPGGESYYAAIWANDQAEYVNPFFPFLGYGTGNESALVSYRHFARFMNEEFKPIPSSIIAEGEDIWNGAGDRGDAAMIAYGASRYLLARGDRAEAEELWPLVEWCLEYCQRRLNEEGVVASDTDELEGRFPAGRANLCTSSLYYDGLLSAAYLGESLKKPAEQVAQYRHRAEALRSAMERYFAATVEGFETYRYYDGNTVLRSWICIPLCMGIDDRREGTIRALFSPRLWTKDGILTQAGSKTFWDRSTLYAMRGILTVGETEKVMSHLDYYSRTRLLGEHVPYPVEAWPEGSQRHLSAESGLYCRIYTEGLFGIRPTGFRSFDLTPRLPREWDRMAMRRVRAFGADMDIEVARTEDGNLEIRVLNGGEEVLSRVVGDGSTVKVNLK